MKQSFDTLVEWVLVTAIAKHWLGIRSGAGTRLEDGNMVVCSEIGSRWDQVQLVVVCHEPWLTVCSQDPWSRNMPTVLCFSTSLIDTCMASCMNLWWFFNLSVKLWFTPIVYWDDSSFNEPQFLSPPTGQTRNSVVSACGSNTRWGWLLWSKDSKTLQDIFFAHRSSKNIFVSSTWHAHGALTNIPCGDLD